jgi:hypothetical protein
METQIMGVRNARRLVKIRRITYRMSSISEEKNATGPEDSNKLVTFYQMALDT